MITTGTLFTPKSEKAKTKSAKTNSAKKIGNSHLVTQIGFEDRDGHASEARLRVSVDVATN